MPTQYDTTQDKDMITHPERWPCWPMLPVKNPKYRDESGWPRLGVIFASNPLEVRHGIIGITDFENPMITDTYFTVDEMLEAGWIVD